MIITHLRNAGLLDLLRVGPLLEGRHDFELEASYGALTFVFVPVALQRRAGEALRCLEVLLPDQRLRARRMPLADGEGGTMMGERIRTRVW